MKEILEILEFEDKTSTNGQGYTRFKTSAGWMSCFDKKAALEIKELKGKSIEVETKETTSGDRTFKNITKFYKVADVVEVVTSGETGTNRNLPMYVSYAKDVFCQLQPTGVQGNAEENMRLSIELVKQAINEFNWGAKKASLFCENGEENKNSRVYRKISPT